MTTLPNLVMASGWRETLNNAFATLRRTAFIILPSTANPLDKNLLQYSGTTGNWGLLTGGNYAPTDLDSIVLKGWALIASNGTFVSASSFTIPGDYTSYLTKGTKLIFTNSGTKYAYVLSSSFTNPNTTINIVVNTDYVIANNVISGVYMTNVATPPGFPSAFSYAASPTGFTAAVPASATYQFNLSSGIVTVFSFQPNKGTSNATTFTESAPMTALTLANGLWGTCSYDLADNNVALAVPGRAYIQQNSSTIHIDKDVGGAGWTNVNGKSASFVLQYPV